MLWVVRESSWAWPGGRPWREDQEGREKKKNRWRGRRCEGGDGGVRLQGAERSGICYIVPTCKRYLAAYGEEDPWEADPGGGGPRGGVWPSLLVVRIVMVCVPGVAIKVAIWWRMKQDRRENKVGIIIIFIRSSIVAHDFRGRITAGVEHGLWLLGGSGRTL